MIVFDLTTFLSKRDILNIIMVNKQKRKWGNIFTFLNASTDLSLEKNKKQFQQIDDLKIE